MEKIKYSYQLNMWGCPEFKKINNFEEWYNKDFTGDAYYLDWDKIIKYLATAGFKGIELMWYQIDAIRSLFGSLPAFTEFLNERGIEKVTGCFSRESPELRFSCAGSPAMPTPARGSEVRTLR